MATRRRSLALQQALAEQKESPPIATVLTGTPLLRSIDVDLADDLWADVGEAVDRKDSDDDEDEEPTRLIQQRKCPVKRFSSNVTTTRCPVKEFGKRQFPQQQPSPQRQPPPPQQQPPPFRVNNNRNIPWRMPLGVPFQLKLGGRGGFVGGRGGFDGGRGIIGGRGERGIIGGGGFDPFYQRGGANVGIIAGSRRARVVPKFYVLPRHPQSYYY